MVGASRHRQFCLSSGAARNFLCRGASCWACSRNSGDGYTGIRKLPGGKDSFGSFLVTEKNDESVSLDCFACAGEIASLAMTEEADCFVCACFDRLCMTIASRNGCQDTPLIPLFARGDENQIASLSFIALMSSLV
jgi:hypothetical protein